MPGNDGLIQRTEEEQKRAIEIHDSFRDELLKRQLSNTENYDKSILTLSSAGLAISLTFLKLIVPLDNAEYIWLVNASWIFFLLSVLLSLVAYLVSNAAISRQLIIAEDYYVNKKESAFNEANKLSLLNNFLNRSVGVFFSLALITVVAFVILNVNKESMNMSDKKVGTSCSQVCLDSATVLTMQRVPTEGVVTHSAETPTMQAAPGGVAQQSQNTSPKKSGS